MTLEIPESIVLPDGTTAKIRGVAANVSDGKLDQIVYTVEKESGAWMDIASEDVHAQPLLT